MAESNVEELRPSLLKKYSGEFVSRYLNDSPINATSWLMSKVEPLEYDRMKVLIREEFEAQGYHFPELGQKGGGYGE